ncbi:hypothetical protein MAMT_00392 [Methylacidimicrobium tartarophylax]|uniref:Uncharacterized protein n=1 Tax=Methylacidimicrobium tartarophylax TaxID=1041768 RepID=A0A5E6MG14_9BACT|nr:hypothetical protein MAMT_00392 [Methylacidimicrobium tartarophylax]
MSSWPICSRSFFNPLALRSASTEILNFRLIFQRESPCFTVYLVEPGGGGSAGASADGGEAEDSAALAGGGVPQKNRAIQPVQEKRRKSFVRMRLS